MRIINRFNLGGPTYNVAYLSKYLDDRFETLLVGGAKDESEDTSTFITESLGLNPIIIDEMRREISPINDYKAYKKLKKIIQDYRPDIVHTHASKAGALGRLAAYHCGVRQIYHTFHGHVFHSYFGKLKTTFYKKIERYLAKRSTKLIAISNLQKKELSDEHDIAKSEKFHVVHLGFDLRRFSENTVFNRKDFRKKYNLKPSEVAIGIVGRLVPIKNHKFFIDAAEKVIQKTKKVVKFFIIGGGELEQELKTYVKAKNLDQKITFTSWIRNIEWAYAGLDIVALTSLNEGTPVSLIEAQAASKPIVSTKVGGIQDVVLEGQSALLSKSADIASFTKNLIQLVESKPLRDQFSGAAQKFVFDRFSYQVLTREMQKLYLSEKV